MLGDKECSHIVNIFEKLQNPPPLNKGNLFLSGIFVLKNAQKIKKFNITCVLTIIDEYTYKDMKINAMV